MCDWLTSRGGAAKVEEVIAEIFPSADIYTSVCNPNLFPWLKGRKIFTTWLNKIPYFRNKHQLFAWLRPILFESFDLGGYDLVISSSSAESKCVITKPETLHVCYCHTPIRYYWSDYHEYIRERLEFGILNPLVRLVMPRMVFDLRMNDRMSAERVDLFVANSQYIVSRIKKYYRRDAKVIYPPVEVNERFNIQYPISNKSHKNKTGEKQEDFYLFVGRLVPYKKADLVVEAFVENGRNLKVIGEGPMLGKIKKLSQGSENIEFLGFGNDEMKMEIMKKCKAVIFPSLEDFGIVPVEAMSLGKPVVAFGQGGARESIVDGITGVFFERQNVKSLNEAIERIERCEFDSERIIERAKIFSKERFCREFEEFILDNIKK